MLRNLCLVGLVLSFAFAPAAAHAAVANSPSQNEVPLPVSDVFIPSGFDSGSDVYVVLNGYFPNTCYSYKDAQINHLSASEHEVRSMALVRPGMCLMVMLPYTQEVQLGRFDRGDHTLRFLNGDGTFIEKHLKVE